MPAGHLMSLFRMVNWVALSMSRDRACFGGGAHALSPLASKQPFSPFFMQSLPHLLPLCGEKPSMQLSPPGGDQTSLEMCPQMREPSLTTPTYSWDETDGDPLDCFDPLGNENQGAKFNGCYDSSLSWYKILWVLLNLTHGRHSASSVPWEWAHIRSSKNF